MKTKNRFRRFLGAAHINYLNAAVYERPDCKITVRIEPIVSGKTLGARVFDSMQQLEHWYATLPGAGAGQLCNAIESITPRVKFN